MVQASAFLATFVSRQCEVLRWSRHFASAVWHTADAPIAQAETPPAQWYHSQEFHDRDAEVLSSGWQLADVHGLEPGSYRAGRMGKVEYLLTKDDVGTLRAFHNVRALPHASAAAFELRQASSLKNEPAVQVCRHHAAIVAQGEGPCPQDCRFQCPYHGWTYDLQGRLVKATQLKGIQGFAARDHGLKPIDVEQWGRFVFLRLPSPRAAASLREHLGGDAKRMLEAAGVTDSDLVHVKRHVYTGLRCNWKVFCDNYLDGGYHVPVAHTALAAGLSLRDYASQCFAHCSVQSCSPSGDARLGAAPVAYAFVFPNVMINRYGPWMDVNVVRPTGPSTCDVEFDWWVKAAHAGDEAFISDSLRASDGVQQEDIELCESVQRGLESPGFSAGRYAPSLEAPMLHFHKLLHAAYQSSHARPPL